MLNSQIKSLLPRLHLNNEFDRLSKAIEQLSFVDATDFSKEDCLLIGTKYLEKNEFSFVELFLLGYIQSKQTTADEIIGLISSVTGRLPIEVNRRLIDAAIKRHPFKKQIIALGIAAQADSKDPSRMLEMLRKKTYAGKLDQADYLILIDILRSMNITLGSFFNSERSNEGIRKLMVVNAFSKLRPIGNDCRLGFLQRDLGFEPLGLFRWASIPLENIVILIEKNFNNFFAYENLSLRYTKHHHGLEEFLVVDNRWNFVSHTFMYDEDRDVILKKAHAHYSWLARAFLEGLEDSGQVYVYKADPPKPRIDYLRLHNALCKFSSKKLVVIEKDSDQDVSIKEELSDEVLLIRLPANDSYAVWEKAIYDNYEFIASEWIE